MEAWKTCAGEKGDMCGKALCVMKSLGVADDTGKIDAAKTIEYVKKTANNDAFVSSSDLFLNFVFKTKSTRSQLKLSSMTV